MSGLLRWGHSGRVVMDLTDGSIGILPDLDDATISDFRKILDAFPDGLCLHVVGDAIGKVCVLGICDDVREHAKDILSELHVPASGLGELDQDLGEAESAEDGAAGCDLHDGSFVIVVLPIDEAYSRFPEIAPSPAKDGQQ